ncbi:MAG: hypothetical protein DHS20C01_19700 [marine bacterium B5-7]|nr:MAG: hypothetical protein DHS20C01_19700 [marine bacterium B5-7]
MAVIHEQRRDGRLYQVRTAGASLRLYTNGVLHSQINPGKRALPNLWHLLTTPALLVEPRQLKRVLVLGVGGGGVLRLLNEIFPDIHITGIEHDPIHLELGKRFFGLDCDNFELIADDAFNWLENAPPKRNNHYDLVIDDLFGDFDGDPRRAVSFDHHWASLLEKRMSPHGVLVANFADAGEFRRSAIGPRSNHIARFTQRASLSLATLENIVAVMSSTPFSNSDWLAAISDHFGSKMAGACTIRRYKAVKPSRRLR